MKQMVITAESGMECNPQEFDLNSDSIIFDVGGYKGEYAEVMFKRFGCTIYCFEPIKEFYDKIVEKFKDNPKVIPLNYGLFAFSSTCTMNKNRDSSSLFSDKGINEQVEMRNIKEVIEEYHIEKLDLLKLNIEGAEYDVLEQMIADKLIEKCVNLAVQFHKNSIHNPENRHTKIVNEIEKTHEKIYDRTFVWEAWSKR